MRQVRLRSQKIMPRGSAMRRSRPDGCSWKWKEIMMASETIARYMDRRSHERKVRSLAQWSRASEVLFSKSKAPSKGRARRIWRWSSTCLYSDQIGTMKFHQDYIKGRKHHNLKRATGIFVDWLTLRPKLALSGPGLLAGCSVQHHQNLLKLIETWWDDGDAPSCLVSSP